MPHTCSFFYKPMKTGKAGLAVAVKNKPDLIICDIEMPDMNVFEVLKKLKTETFTQKMPFIFLTARAEKSEVKNGITSGADNYLTKPFRGDELVDMVAKYLEV